MKQIPWYSRVDLVLFAAYFFWLLLILSPYIFLVQQTAYGPPVPEVVFKLIPAVVVLAALLVCAVLLRPPFVTKKEWAVMKALYAQGNRTTLQIAKDTGLVTRSVQRSIVRLKLIYVHVSGRGPRGPTYELTRHGREFVEIVRPKLKQ